MWYQKYDSFVLGLGFLISKSDHYVSSKHNRGHFLIIIVYVDDMLFFGNSKNVICDLKSKISIQFHVEDWDSTKYNIGMEIKRERENIEI